MFDFFRRKNKKADVDEALNADFNAAIDKSSMILDLYLSMFRDYPDFHEKINSNIFRGYLIGFFDVSAGASGIKFQDDETFFRFQSFSHMKLLYKDIAEPIRYAMDSLCLKGEYNFDRGHKIGISEGLELFDQKISPHKIMGIFIGNVPI